MSRSYKKTPVVKDGNSGKVAKKFANHKVRGYKKDLSNGKAYRKVFETRDIHDMVNYYSYQSFKKNEESYRKEYENGVRKYPFYTTEKKWLKYYKRK